MLFDKLNFKSQCIETIIIYYCEKYKALVQTHSSCRDINTITHIQH